MLRLRRDSGKPDNLERTPRYIRALAAMLSKLNSSV